MSDREVSSVVCVHACVSVCGCAYAVRDVLGHKGSSEYKTIFFVLGGGGLRPSGVVVHSNCLKKISCLHTEFLSIL